MTLAKTVMAEVLATARAGAGAYTDTPSGKSLQQTGAARKEINPENWKATFRADGLALTSKCRECLDEGRPNIRAQQEGAAEKENKPGDAASGNDGSDFIGVLSSKISSYKGTVPTNTLLAIVKARRFDLPPGIETNAADFGKVIAVVQEAFTQLRAKFKKASQAQQDRQEAGAEPRSSKHLQARPDFVEGSQCTVTVELCARIALMSIQEDGPKFRDKLDSALAGIRAKASGDAKMIARAFRHILEKDQDLHGVKVDYSIADSAVEKLQQEVDDIIDANTLNAATSGAAPIAA
ncbi:hypothetical protein B0H14DRAFT_3171851 [Mycena olivaceomarginata]|nr:hypothetical protein B0H14DRAFT_3171851 [Mycena olivaceomarginata]